MVGMSDYFLLMRPKQWVKNVFVFLPVLFSFQVFNINQVARSMVAFVALCLASSAVYAFNDSLDYEADKLHPRKKNRPIAAGRISPILARCFALSLVACTFVFAQFLSVRVVAIVGMFIIMNALYSVILKKVPYLDICCIALGFVLRMLAGSAAIEVKTSYFLFGTVFFLSLFMAAGKRGQELQEVSNSARRVLGFYSLKAITVIEIVSMVFCCSLYSAWVYSAFVRGLLPWVNFLTIPLVVYGFWVYYQNLFKGPYGDPTEIVFSSKKLQIVFLFYVGLIVSAITLR